MPKTIIKPTPFAAKPLCAKHAHCPSRCTEFKSPKSTPSKTTRLEPQDYQRTSKNVKRTAKESKSWCLIVLCFHLYEFRGSRHFWKSRASPFHVLPHSFTALWSQSGRLQQRLLRVVPQEISKNILGIF